MFSIKIVLRFCGNKHENSAHSLYVTCARLIFPRKSFTDLFAAVIMFIHWHTVEDACEAPADSRKQISLIHLIKIDSC